MNSPKTVGELLDLAERVLTDSTHLFEEHDNRAEAEELLAFCLDTAPSRLRKGFVPSVRLRDRFLALVARRAAGEPFPFLIGRIEFDGLDLRVRPGTFVPRPSSELTVARAAAHLRNKTGATVVDVCTGAGPIALAIAYRFSDADVWGVDISAPSLDLARYNARRLGIDNVRFRKGDLYDTLPLRLKGSVDVITGHVPYVPRGEVEDLPSEVKDFEPEATLTDYSDDGLGVMRRTVLEAPAWLKPRGWLLLEMSQDIVSEVKRICRRAGYRRIDVVSDEYDLSVVVEARA